MSWLSETINLGLDRLVLDYVFGPDVPALAYFKVLGATERGFKADIEVDRFALQAGHPISREQFAERYNRPVPDAHDTLLKLAPKTFVQLPIEPAGHPVSNAANEARRRSKQLTVFPDDAAAARLMRDTRFDRFKLNLCARPGAGSTKPVKK